MHRVDSEGSIAGMFTEGDPGQAIPATVVGDDWLNAVQEEVCNLLEAMGVTLNKASNVQLRDACVAAATAEKIVRRDAAGRAKVADPSADADIDTKGARNAAITTHAGVTSTHGATADATADRIVLRDAAGRAAFADPSAAGDADTKGARDAALVPLDTRIGTLEARSKVVAAGRFNGVTTTMDYEQGVAGFTRTSAGVYTVQLDAAPTHSTPIVSGANAGVIATWVNISGAYVGIRTTDAAGNLADAAFTLIVLDF